MGDDATPERALPPGSRASITGLASKPELNGAEVTVLEWREAQGRFAVYVVAGSGLRGGVAAAAAGVLVRPECLTRCACPFDLLPPKCLAECLSRLRSWTDAARAWAVHPLWRDALRAGAWPPCGATDLVPPAHWASLRAFGHDWSERRPYAHPRAWAAPAASPSWLSALHGFHDTPLAGREREGPAALLRWLDRMARDWPGVCITRWSGVARRLAWARGEPDAKLRVGTLRGNIGRVWPPNGPPASATPHSYKGGGTLRDAAKRAPPCLFRLPAEAALYQALMPEGFGEHESCDGEGDFNGLVVDLAPWKREPDYFARRNSAANVAQMGADALGCEPGALLDVAHQLREESGALHPGMSAAEQLEALTQFVLFLCCDPASSHYGSLLCVHSFASDVGDGSGPQLGVSIGWWDVGLVGLLHAIADEADSLRAAHGPGTPWDELWAEEHGGVESVEARMAEEAWVPLPGHELEGARAPSDAVDAEEALGRMSVSGGAPP